MAKVAFKTKPVATAFADFVIATDARKAAADDVTAKAENRKAYEALSVVCREYVGQFKDRNGLPIPMSDPPEPFPPIVANIVHAMIEGWLVGKADLSLRDLLDGPGKPGRSLYERNDIEDACRYMQAVDNGLIADRTPVSRVAAWFGVQRSTAQSWQRDAKREDLLKDFMPDVTISARMSVIKSRAVVAGKRHAIGRKFKSTRATAKPR